MKKAILFGIITLSLCFNPKAYAAVFDVSTIGELITAINTANGNGEADVINLPTDGNLEVTAVDNTGVGPNGFPVITSPITINGNGTRLFRDSASPNFRFFQVNSGGDLELNVLILEGGNPDSNGGALYVGSSGEAILNGCQIINNTGSQGGGIYNNNGTLTLMETLVQGNDAVAVVANAGGGLIFFGDSTNLIMDSTINDNEATNGGGGGIQTESSFDLINSTVSRNSANFGGGGINGSGTGLIWTVTNSTISGNTAGSSGGGIRIDNATLVLNNATITDNTATNGSGGGIDNPNSGNVVEIQNTIVAGNFDLDDGATPDCRSFASNAPISGGYNLIGDDSGCMFTMATGDQLGTAGAEIDPMLDPLANYGGPTETHRLQALSPAIDAGNDVTGCQDDMGMALTTDQRLLPRPAIPGTRCDTGAFEAQAPTADLSALAVDFGDQMVNETSVSQSIVITNNGELPLVISDIAIDGPFAQTDDCDMPILPGDTCTLMITFTPTTVGMESGSITLTDNALDSPQVITLTGNGVTVGPVGPIVIFTGGGCALTGSTNSWMTWAFGLAILGLFVALRRRIST